LTWYGICELKKQKDKKRAKAGRKRSKMWQGWITGGLGVWLIITSFLLNGNAFNELGVGVTVAVIGFWAAATRL
jgi:hypothetical protein